MNCKICNKLVAPDESYLEERDVEYDNKLIKAETISHTIICEDCNV